MESIEWLGPQRQLAVVLGAVHRDARGSFEELLKASHLARLGITGPWPQVNLSTSQRGVLRGLHYQESPKAQGKLVRCLAGSIYDVALDIRPDSATRGHWHAITLKAGDAKSLWVPPGFAHGFQALEDGTQVLYAVTMEYDPSLDRALRWDSPALGIPWPIRPPGLSLKDASAPPWADGVAKR